MPGNQSFTPILWILQSFWFLNIRVLKLWWNNRNHYYPDEKTVHTKFKIRNTESSSSSREHGTIRFKESSYIFKETEDLGSGKHGLNVLTACPMSTWLKASDTTANVKNCKWSTDKSNVFQHLPYTRLQWLRQPY